MNTHAVFLGKNNIISAEEEYFNVKNREGTVITLTLTRNAVIICHCLLAILFWKCPSWQKLLRITGEERWMPIYWLIPERGINKIGRFQYFHWGHQWPLNDSAYSCHLFTYQQHWYSWLFLSLVLFLYLPPGYHILILSRFVCF